MKNKEVGGKISYFHNFSTVHAKSLEDDIDIVLFSKFTEMFLVKMEHFEHRNKTK